MLVELVRHGPRGGSRYAEEDSPQQRAAALAGRIIAAAALLAGGTGQWIELIGQFDASGLLGEFCEMRSMAHFLSRYCGLGTGTAREHVRVARRLRSLPQVAAAFNDGALSYSKVRELTRVADHVPEDVLLRLARGLTAAQLERAVRGLRASRAQRLAAERDRRLSWREHEDGTMTITLRAPTEQAARVLAAIEAAHDHLNTPAPTPAPSRPPGAFPREHPGRRPGRAVAGRHRPHPVAVYPRRCPTGVAETYLQHGPADDSGADRDRLVIHITATDLAEAMTAYPHAAGGARSDRTFPRERPSRTLLTRRASRTFPPDRPGKTFPRERPDTTFPTPAGQNAPDATRGKNVPGNARRERS